MPATSSLRSNSRRATEPQANSGQSGSTVREGLNTQEEEIGPVTDDATDDATDELGKSSSPTLDERLQLAQRAKEELLKRKQLEQLEREIADLRQGLSTAATGNTSEHAGRSEDRSTSYPTSRDTGSIRTETIREMSEETIPRPPPAVDIVGGKRPLRDGNDLGPYRKTLKPSSLEKYEGKSLREHRDWTRDAETCFRLTPYNFETDESKILYVMQYLKGDAKEFWYNYEREHPVANQTWDEFKLFLLNLIEDPANRTLDIAQAMTDAQQRPGQSVRQFDAYLSSLEAQLPPYNEDQRRTNLLTRLRPNLRLAIMNVQQVPVTRNELVVLASRLESNQKKANSITHKAAASAPAKENKGNTKGRRNRSEGNSKDTPSKSKENNGSTYPKKDLKDVECFTCGKKGHYSTTCPKGKDTNPNKTLVGHLGQHAVEESGKGNPSSKASSKGRGKKKKNST